MGDIDGVHRGLGPNGCERERDDAATGSDVGEASGWVFCEVWVVAEEADEFFGFGAWDEGPRIAAEGFSEEIDCAEEMLEGFAGGAAFDEFAERG